MNGDSYQIQVLDRHSQFWENIDKGYYDDIRKNESAIKEHIQVLRDKIFRQLANEKLYNRRRKRFEKRFELH